METELSDRRAARERRKLAKVAGLSRFSGAVCGEHPMLGGERLVSGWKCPACYNARRRSRRVNDPDWRERVNARARPRGRLPSEEKQRRQAERAERRVAVRQAREEVKAALLVAREAARPSEEEKRRRKREAKRRERQGYNSRYPEKKKVRRRVHNAKRRAAERAALVVLTPDEQRRMQAIYAEARRRTRETGRQWDVHHIVPLSKGGQHHPNNLEAIPSDINQAIGDTPMSALEYILS